MEIKGKNTLNIIMGLCITALFAIFLHQKVAFLETLESKLFDFRFKFRGAVKQQDAVVIAAIDEKSIEALGRWPWSRDKIAKLVDRLSKDGAEVIVFDVIFSEKEKNDRKLAQSIRNAGNVVLSIVFDFDKEQTVAPGSSLEAFSITSIVDEQMFAKYAPIMAKRVLIPVPELAKEVMTMGHINMFPDPDGVLRWESILIGYRGNIYPSTTLQAAATYLGVPQDQIVVSATQGVQLGQKRFIPTDHFGRTLINYYGSNQTFKYIPISDIIDGTADKSLLQGKIVLIGATSVGIYDLRVTPFSAAMPGVEKHASVITSILDNKFMTKAASSTDMTILCLTGVLFTFLVIRFKAAGAAAAAGASLFVIFAAGYYFFRVKGLWLNILYPSLDVLVIFISVTAYNYAVEEKYSRRIKGMFSSYVTERVVNELIKNPDMARLGGEKREITILFSDVRGFTTFSEKHPAEVVVAILNEYLGAMTDVVFKWEGTLDKFIGDAILAFWNAPMKQDDHAEMAVKCAMDMIRRLGELQKKWEAEGKAGLDIGIGINTGEVVVGNIGAEGKKMDYTVIGDHVNLGSRVESLTRKYDAHILITQFTFEKIRESVVSGRLGHVNVEGIEKVIVKGKDEPVGIYRVSSAEHGAESKITECGEDSCVVRLKEK